MVKYKDMEPCAVQYQQAYDNWYKRSQSQILKSAKHYFTKTLENTLKRAKYVDHKQFMDFLGKEYHARVGKAAGKVLSRFENTRCVTRGYFPDYFLVAATSYSMHAHMAQDDPHSRALSEKKERFKNAVREVKQTKLRLRSVKEIMDRLKFCNPKLNPTIIAPKLEKWLKE